MAATVLGALFTRDRRTDTPALAVPGIGRQYDYRRFCTIAWKVGNLFHHFGVRPGVSVAVAGEKRPEPLFALCGATLVGGVVRFDSIPSDARVLVAPTVDLGTYDVPPGCQRIGYGEQPGDPNDAFFEGDVWSENPTRPPTEVEADTPVLADDTVCTHERLLRGGRSVVDRWELTTESTVAVRGPLQNPKTIVAGVIAPLLVGGTILFPDENSIGEYAITTETAPEPRTLTLDSIEL